MFEMSRDIRNVNPWSGSWAQYLGLFLPLAGKVIRARQFKALFVCLFVCFKISHISEIMHYLSFSV